MFIDTYLLYYSPCSEVTWGPAACTMVGGRTTAPGARPATSTDLSSPKTTCTTRPPTRYANI